MTRRITGSLTLVKISFVLACFVGVALPGSAYGQFQQYTPPGTTSDRPGDDKARLEKEMEDALWELGGLRLSPWVGITNARVVSNTFSRPSGDDATQDVTLTLGAGVRGIVPFDQKTFLTLELVPQYVFWVDQGERNRFNQWYGARLFGFYNRLYLETGARRREQVEIRTSEADIETNTRRDLIDLLAEVRVGNKVHLFGGAGYTEITTLEDEVDDRLPTFSSQDRDESILRGGVRYKWDANSFVGLGVEASDVEFVETARDRSNDGTAPLVEFQYDSPQFFATGEIVFRDLEPSRETSLFVPYDDPTGRLQLTFNPGWRMTYSPYWRKSLTYSLTEEYSYFDYSRLGLRVGAILSDRWNGSLYVEGGPDDYVAIEPDTPERGDDFSSVGIDFSFKVSERFALSFGYSIDDWSSSLPEFDRENSRFRLSFNTGGLVFGRR